MANSRRFQNILSHLSPPVTTNSLESPQPSRCSALELGPVGECSGNPGAVEDILCQETKFQLGNLLKLECRGPNTDREAKLIENLMLSRLHRFRTELRKRDVFGSHSEPMLVPCRGEPLKSQEMAEEHVDSGNLEITRELENPEPCGESGVGTGDGLCDGEGELTKSTESVRAGITSASAVSSSGAASFNPGPSPTKLESKPRGQLSACEFCDIIQGSAPCFKLYEDELCLCILDINPLSFGHSLILPKAHFPCLEATPPQVAAAMCAAVPLISRALLAATRCDSFNMLVNSGVAAGQVIMHTHFHIIPRCKGDGLWQSESATRRPMRKVQEAKSLAHAVRTTLSTVGSVVPQATTPLGFNREGLN